MRKTRGRIVAAVAQASMRDCLAAATPTAPQPVDFQAGLRTRTRIVCLRLQARTGPARLPVRHLAMRSTVADAPAWRAYRCGGSAGMAAWRRHRLPVSTRRQDAARVTWKCGDCTRARSSPDRGHRRHGGNRRQTIGRRAAGMVGCHAVGQAIQHRVRCAGSSALNVAAGAHAGCVAKPMRPCNRTAQAVNRARRARCCRVRRRTRASDRLPRPRRWS